MHYSNTVICRRWGESEKSKYILNCHRKFIFLFTKLKIWSNWMFHMLHKVYVQSDSLQHRYILEYESRLILYFVPKCPMRYLSSPLEILPKARSHNSSFTVRHKKKKNLVWHSHNFLLPNIIVEKYFINSITFIFNFYFICFVINELPAFIIIVYNFWRQFPAIVTHISEYCSISL